MVGLWMNLSVKNSNCPTSNVQFYVLFAPKKNYPYQILIAFIFLKILAIIDFPV
jgi:hypothetical protein